MLGSAPRGEPAKIVVFNNGALSFVELEMKAAGIVTYGTELDNPDFAGIARAAGLFGAWVDKADELEDTLQTAFAHNGPVLVDVRTARQEQAASSSKSPRPTCGNWKSSNPVGGRSHLGARYLAA